MTILHINFIHITSFYKKKYTYTATTYQIVIVENKKVPTSLETAAKDAMIIVVPIYQGRLRPQIF